MTMLTRSPEKNFNPMRYTGIFNGKKEHKKLENRPAWYRTQHNLEKYLEKILRFLGNYLKTKSRE